EAHRLLQLLIGAGTGIAVGPPAHELGGVPEPRALHVVVADLHHPFRPERGEGQVLGGVPPAVLGRARGPRPRLLVRPVPRMRVKRGDQRLELGEQLPAALHRERADDADAGPLPGGAGQAAQERAPRAGWGVWGAGPAAPAGGAAACGLPLNMPRRSGSYTPASGLATIPSRPAPSNWASHRWASAWSVVAGVTWRGVAT